MTVPRTAGISMQNPGHRKAGVGRGVEAGCNGAFFHTDLDPSESAESAEPGDKEGGPESLPVAFLHPSAALDPGVG